jgi:transcription elongation factor GreA
MMELQEMYLTKEGLEKLQAELGELKQQRVEITQKIKEAREFGDLSENAEYQEAKTKQSFVEGRIEEIEATLKLAKVVDRDDNDNKNEVAIGSKVSVRVNGSKYDYEITGSNEASPAEGRISNESPLGRALLGCQKGSKFTLETPDGGREYEVLGVS